MSKRWKYLTVKLPISFMGGTKPEELQAELNRQGQQGWELVQVVQYGTQKPVLVFKQEQ